MLIRQLDLELFGGCNYACQVCPHSIGRDRDFRKAMPWYVFTKVVDDAAGHGVETISLHGGGEPTLYKRLPEAVSYAKGRARTVWFATNAHRLTRELSRRVIDAGVDYIRASILGAGYNEYALAMGVNALALVKENLGAYVGMGGRLRLYHLVKEEWEVEAYQRLAEELGAQSEIWRQHNWAGSIEAPERAGVERTCGRPFAPMLQVRAGGLDGHHGAVVACCMVLGKDAQAVLGHLDTQTISQVVEGGPYQSLRRAHLDGKWNDVSYCKGCDQLKEAPEVLVWTNIPQNRYGLTRGGLELVA